MVRSLRWSEIAEKSENCCRGVVWNDLSLNFRSAPKFLGLLDTPPNGQLYLFLILLQFVVVVKQFCGVLAFPTRPALRPALCSLSERVGR